jgi:hypothetical protein
MTLDKPQQGSTRQQNQQNTDDIRKRANND